jgi:hypothetical protein
MGLGKEIKCCDLGTAGDGNNIIFGVVGCKGKMR